MSRHDYYDPVTGTSAWAEVNKLPPPIGWWVTDIYVPRDVRGTGVASRLMSRVLADADAAQATVNLVIVGGDGLSNDAIRAWCERMGFRGAHKFFRKYQQFTRPARAERVRSAA